MPFLAAEIEMHRRVHAGAFLVVEGKDDLRFWRRWRHSDCELIDGEGKDKVVNGVRRLDSRGVRGVLGVVDSDYDTFKGPAVGDVAGVPGGDEAVGGGAGLARHQSPLRDPWELI